MGFAWHKLIPNQKKQCFSAQVCVFDVSQPAVTGDICIDPCAWQTGPSTCSLACPPVIVEGLNCVNFVFLEELSSDYQSSSSGGGPRELRLSGIMPCTVNNTNSQFPHNLADPGTWGGSFGYYYRTPVSPSSTPTDYSFAAICAKYTTYTVHDRMIIISGRNRYRYAGWGVDPQYNNTIPPLWHNTISGATGLSQAEGFLGREWPLPDSILDLPLWGADTSRNPGAETVTDCSGATIIPPCIEPSCFDVRPNQGMGHYNTSGQSPQNGQGLYSFQCFNPQSSVAYLQDPVLPIPTCSLFSLVRSIWDYAWRNSIYADEADFRENHPDVTNAFNNLIQSNPSISVNGKSNVRHYLEQFADSLETNLAFIFKIPNVFLWDKEAYTNAAGSDKWKHLYVIGNGNILQDTGCIATAYHLGESGHVGRLFILDDVTHSTSDPQYNARVVHFWGCNSTIAIDNNQDSRAKVSMTLADCVPTDTKGNPTTNYCQTCANADSSVSDCTYKGPHNNCPDDSEDEGPPFN
jgi:hypothetical protein